MVAYPKFTLDLPAIQNQNKLIVQSPKLLATAMKRNTSRLKSRWKEALSAEPPSAQNFYPFRYKSAKQRRKVHAMRRERGGGAYVRTHKLSKAWKVEIVADEKGGGVVVENKNPAAVFVYGEFRQPMFDAAQGGVPWLDPEEVNRKFMLEATQVLEQTWFTIGDNRAGVR